jgi:phospholipase/carboxylesterase
VRAHLASIVHVVVAVLVGALAACDPSVPPPQWTERVVAPRRTTSEAPPLLVLLHGLGGDERNLLPFAEHLDPRFLVVSVRAPRTHRGGYAWFRLTWIAAGDVVPDREQARESLADLVRWVEAAPRRLGADRRRVFLLGFSQGAMMSLGVLRAAPERLAGVVALSGHFDEELFDEAAAADAIARVPLFVAHGTNDDVLPIADGRAIRAFFTPRARDFAYREYPIAHAIGPDELRDVAEWLRRRLESPGLD